MVGGVSRSIRHGEYHAGPYRACQLDGRLDLLVTRSELLRTCEVGDRSRFAVEGEDLSQVHQLFCLGVENASGVCLLELDGIGLV